MVAKLGRKTEGVAGSDSGGKASGSSQWSIDVENTCGGQAMTDRKDFESEDSAILEDIRDDDSAARPEQQIEIADLAAKGQRVRTTLKARLGEDVYSSWFASLEFQSFDGKTLRASVPVKFLKTWIQTHYSDALLTCCAQ